MSDTTTTKKPRERFDMDETTKRARAALDKLRVDQSPGTGAAHGGKAAVLRAVLDRLQALAEDRFSSGQMATALRDVIPNLSAHMVRAVLREAARAGKKGGRRRAAGTARRTTRDDAATGAGATTETAPGGGRPSTDPSAGAAPVPAAPNPGAAASVTGTIAGLTPEQRAQYKIPDWADGSDMRAGETPERYGRRKRMEGPEHGKRDLSNFRGGG